MKKKEHCALTKCFYCGEAGDILLARTYTHAGEPVKDLAPYNGKVISMDPCSKCSGYMQQGVILLTIDTAKSEPNWNKPPTGEKGWMPNPYRTGGFLVIRDEAIRRMFEGGMADFALRHRFAFIEHEAAEKMGLFNKEGEQNEQE